jgi:hypothetical protein
VRWRFLAAPGRRYELLGLAGARGTLAGLAALRHGSHAAPGELVVVDWLVPEDEPAAGAELLAGVLALARRRGARAVVALLPPWSRWSERFTRAGFDPRASDCCLTARSGPATARHRAFMIATAAYCTRWPTPMRATAPACRCRKYHRI